MGYACTVNHDKCLPLPPTRVRSILLAIYNGHSNNNGSLTLTNNFPFHCKECLNVKRLNKLASPFIVTRPKRIHSFAICSFFFIATPCDVMLQAKINYQPIESETQMNSILQSFCLQIMMIMMMIKRANSFISCRFWSVAMLMMIRDAFEKQWKPESRNYARKCNSKLHGVHFAASMPLTNHQNELPNEIVWKNSSIFSSFPC